MKKPIIYNKSKTYLLPLMSEVLGLEVKFLPYLINTFMFDENNEFQNCLLIQHEFTFKNPEFTAYEHRLTNSNLFVKHIDLNGEVVYVFKFPDEYLPEYYALYDSKYSDFGEDAKQLILRFWGTVYSGNPNGIPFITKVKQILYRDSKLREKLEKELKVKIDPNQELGDLVSLENETFKLTKIEEIENKITK